MNAVNQKEDFNVEKLSSNVANYLLVYCKKKQTLLIVLKAASLVLHNFVQVRLLFNNVHIAINNVKQRVGKYVDGELQAIQNVAYQ
jgi:hypothetical protein